MPQDNPAYTLTDGIPLTTSALLGAGGEGSVYRLESHPNSALKIWNEKTAAGSAPQKVQAMLNAPAPEPGHNVAWPTHAALNRTGDCAGFLMPLIHPDKHQQIFHLFNPSARGRLQRQWRTSISQKTLLTAAINLAAAFQNIHHPGHLVVGDVNERNALSDKDGNIILVDADSFQITDPKTHIIYRCTKGRDDYTSPRMQGLELSKNNRTQDDDRFGMAVLIFKLLMDGIHPYSSTADPDDRRTTTLAQKIASQYFPYNESGHTPVQHQPSQGYRQAWQNLDFELRHMFRRAFDPDVTSVHQRPTPAQWTDLLTQLRADPARMTHQPRQAAQTTTSEPPKEAKNPRGSQTRHAPPANQPWPGPNQPATAGPARAVPSTAPPPLPPRHPAMPPIPHWDTKKMLTAAFITFITISGLLITVATVIRQLN